MNAPHRGDRSLIERAAEVYDLTDLLRSRRRADAVPAAPVQPEAPAPAAGPAAPDAATAAMPENAAEPVVAADPASRPVPSPQRTVSIDRALLRQQGFIVPDGGTSALFEEFRIVKRQLLTAISGAPGQPAIERGERILVCSAVPAEGKTYCAINLALSIAAERDSEVLLIDADFAKPSIPALLGFEAETGFMDALADPGIDVAELVIGTDVPGLSVLAAGRRTPTDSEYLASARTAKVLGRLTEGNAHRVLLFDSPPALAASPASELARHVGQTVMVVRADSTDEDMLRDAIALLSGCQAIRLLLNRASFSASGRRFGAYYAYGDPS